MPKALLWFFLILPLSANRVQVYVLKYGESMFPAYKIDQDFSKGHYLPFVWLMFLVRIRYGGRAENILIDTGFTQKGYAKPNGVKQLMTAKTLLARLKIKTAAIDKIILTHTHFDHLGGLHQFKNATVYLQKKEFDWFSRKPYSRRFLKILLDFRRRGKIKLVSNNYRLNDHIRLIRTGAHTPGTQSVLFKTSNATFLIVGDDCYYIETCQIGRSSGVISSKYRLKKLQQLIQRYQQKESFSIKTFHDPLVLKGKKQVSKGVYRLY